jgi:hypothetical protein
METILLQRMIAYFGSDIRRINHALKVYAFAQALSGDLPENKRTPLLLAAILHDIGIKNAEIKYHSNSGEYQELEGPPVARDLLEQENISEAVIDRVCFLVGHHHSYSKIDGIDFQILVEADLLVNFYEDHLPPLAVKSIKEKYFKTAVGLSTVMDIFGV